MTLFESVCSCGDMDKDWEWACDSDRLGEIRCDRLFATVSLADCCADAREAVPVFDVVGELVLLDVFVELPSRVGEMPVLVTSLLIETVRVAVSDVLRDTVTLLETVDDRVAESDEDVVFDLSRELVLVFVSVLLPLRVSVRSAGETLEESVEKSVDD